MVRVRCLLRRRLLHDIKYVSGGENQESEGRNVDLEDHYADDDGTGEK